MEQGVAESGQAIAQGALPQFSNLLQLWAERPAVDRYLIDLLMHIDEPGFQEHVLDIRHDVYRAIGKCARIGEFGKPPFEGVVRRNLAVVAVDATFHFLELDPASRPQPLKDCAYQPPPVGPGRDGRAKVDVVDVAPILAIRPCFITGVRLLLADQLQAAEPCVDHKPVINVKL